MRHASDARWAWALGWAGIVLALAVFMIDAWRALPHGRDAVLQVLPTTFNWPLFGAALLLMAAPLNVRRFAFARRQAIYFFRVALMSASMWSRYFSNARRPAALSRYSVRGVRPANVFSHST